MPFPKAFGRPVGSLIPSLSLSSKAVLPTPMPLITGPHKVMWRTALLLGTQPSLCNACPFSSSWWQVNEEPLLRCLGRLIWFESRQQEGKFTYFIGHKMTLELSDKHPQLQAAHWSVYQGNGWGLFLASTATKTKEISGVIIKKILDDGYSEICPLRSTYIYVRIVSFTYSIMCVLLCVRVHLWVYVGARGLTLCHFSGATNLSYVSSTPQFLTFFILMSSSGHSERKSRGPKIKVIQENLLHPQMWSRWRWVHSEGELVYFL